ncbi:MAG: acyl-CoA thioesterase [Lentisphaeria bacterium]|nr:acyl-CoA thioesterase [Lentisphaeria bacterium]
MKARNTVFKDPEGAPRPVETTVSHRIYFNETDALGIVWHGNYPVYFEQAVTELLHKLGMSPHQLHQAGVGTPLAQLHIDYKIPLYLDETIQTTAKLHWHDGPRLNFELSIQNEKGEIACRATIVQMFIDLATRNALWCSPPIWEDCKKKWIAGEFYRD